MNDETTLQRARRLAKEWMAQLDHQGNSRWRKWVKHVYMKGYMTALEDAREGRVQP